MSESTLSRRLNAEQTKFSWVLKSLRMNYGLYLLFFERYSIAQIAQMCGYQSASRFSAVFKQTFGVVPSHLMDSYLAAPTPLLAYVGDDE